MLKSVQTHTQEGTHNVPVPDKRVLSPLLSSSFQLPGVHDEVVGVLAQVHMAHTREQEARDGVLICNHCNQRAL